MNPFTKRIFQSLTQLMLLAMVSLPALVQAEPPLDIATTPLASSGPTVIKPNMLYVLDDSGSMGRDYMPDWATSNTYKDDASYNAVAYNPAVRYDPPAYYNNNGSLNTTTYPSQTGTSTAKGKGSGGSSTNWRSVKNNAYRGGDGLTNLENLNGGAGPRYTVSIATEYCTRTDLRVCVSSSNPTVTHPYPAQIRWCSNAAVAIAAALPADNACQSVRTGSFTNIRLPIATTTTNTYEATITITQAGKVSNKRPKITNIKVNGQEILAQETQRKGAKNLAVEAAQNISLCTSSVTGQCDVAGYQAVVPANKKVKIFAPDASVVGLTPVVTANGGNFQYTATQFTAVVQSAGSGINRVAVNIASGSTYPYPGSAEKHPVRTDCNGATCTYAEEMENYANWHTYYRTRMQMMKTSTSLAFQDVGSDFRMGFMTINTSSSRALDFKDFSGANKAAWYVKLFSINPSGGTPLRDALGKAGRIYADKYSLSNTFSDPVQYECQQNFTLLTTDGKWNGAAGKKVNGQNMTNQDNDISEKGKYEGSANQSSDQLADVAKYYRDTDLRTTALGNCTGALGANVCETTGSTPAVNKEQTMVTFTLGLGVDGTLAYDVDYGPTVPGDFKSIYDGNLEWPVASSDSEETFDDLWHAAVNGDGRYFSAKKTSELISQLREAIALIKVTTGAGAAAATSTLNPVSGDNYAYVASFTSGFWQGNLEKREIDLTTGEVQKAAVLCVEDVVPDTNCAAPSSILPDGSGGYSCVTTGVTDQASCAEALVGSECRIPVIPTCEGELKTQTTRNIYFNKAGALTPFSVSDLSLAQEANFTPAFLSANLTQGASYNTLQDSNLTSDKVVDYIKGDKTYEQNSPIIDNQLFRKRDTVLGDLIDSKPSFIGTPTFNYGDSGYQAFKTAQASRAGTVYVGSNDGMLHAFNSDTLAERWAFVPSVVIPNLWKLADSNYAAKHSYYVNGDITISDICVAADCSTATASDWKTILVAGLDAGGRGYYALDITNPTSPQVLWEIDPNTDADFNNLGYTYGNPIVTKRSGDEKWVVVFTSGYNNIPDNDSFYSSPASTAFKPNLTPQFTTGNGRGYLYIVDAVSGSRLATISNSSGSQASPSGLAKIAAYADFAEKNNVSKYVYGGDLDGDLWRFNIDSSANSVLHFARLRDASNNAQPIMTPPELGEINNKKVVFIGTGKYLEVTDLDAASFRTQSLYALKDTANDGDPGPVFSNPRSVTGIVNQSIVPHSDPTKPNERISGTSNTVDFTTDAGWYIDFPDSGERQNVASQLVLGTLLVPTTVPTASACQPAGYGWFNFLDYKTGLSVVTASGTVSMRTSAPSVGFNVVFIDGAPKVSNVLSDDPNPTLLDGIKFDASSSGFQLKRSIWREIID